MSMKELQELPVGILPDFVLALLLRFVSKPMVSSKMFRQFSLVLRSKSGSG